LKALDKDSAQT